MMTTNRISLLGNAVKKATITTFEGGNRVAQLSLATNERGFTTKSGTVVPDRTDFHTLVVKGGLVDVVEKYIDKGSKMAIIGSLRYRDFVNKSGQKCRVAEIHVREIELLGRANAGQPQAEPQEQEDVSVVEKQVFTATDEDDLPF